MFSLFFPPGGGYSPKEGEKEPLIGGYAWIVPAYTLIIAWFKNQVKLKTLILP